MQENNVNKLISDTADIRKRFEEKWRKTGEKYNLFMVADIADKEVIMCRILADFLNPQGKHCQGSRFLIEFWKIISPKLPEPLNLKIDETKVTAEYVIDENRRIDITLEDGAIFIPVEVKINAGDQPKQVKDYYEFAKKKNNPGVNVPVLYLTVDGHEPSEFSKDGVKKDAYVRLSFKDDILIWLDACERANSQETTVPVRENLRQFIAAVKSLCGKSEDAEMENEIFKLITKDDESVRAAQAICGAMNFENRLCEAFKGKVLELVKKAFAGSVYTCADGWSMIQVPVMGGNYLLDVNCDWKSIYMEICVDEKERNRLLEERMAQEMTIRTNHRNEVKDSFFGLYGTFRYPGFESVDENLYSYRLCKLYIENPQEAADKIIALVRALENVKA